MMVDREVNELFPKQECAIGDVLLQVKGLTVNGEFNNVTFNIRRGEIWASPAHGRGTDRTGGNHHGRQEKRRGSTILQEQCDFVDRITEEAFKRGIAMLPEGPQEECAYFCGWRSRSNVLVSALKKCMRGPFIQRQLEKKCFDAYAEKLEIRHSSWRQTCKNLSGGNQQKVAVARVLNADPEVIILDEPTRGIDVKTKSEIHRLHVRAGRDRKGGAHGFVGTA